MGRWEVALAQEGGTLMNGATHTQEAGEGSATHDQGEQPAVHGPASALTRATQNHEKSVFKLLGSE